MPCERSHIGAVIGARVFVVTKQDVISVGKFRNEYREIVHVRFRQQVSHTRMPIRVKIAILGDSVVTDSNHHSVSFHHYGYQTATSIVKVTDVCVCIDSIGLTTGLPGGSQDMTCPEARSALDRERMLLYGAVLFQIDGVNIHERKNL